MRDATKIKNGRINGIQSEPNSTASNSSSCSNHSVSVAVAATGNILAQTMIMAATEKVQRYRLNGATMSVDRPNVPSRATDSYSATTRSPASMTPASSINDSSHSSDESRPSTCETASATSNFPTRTTTPHPITKVRDFFYIFEANKKRRSTPTDGIIFHLEQIFSGKLSKFFLIRLKIVRK